MTAKIYAHRGYSEKYPENTMVAFKAAHAAGADGIELDVHMTKDGALVICHDEAMDRTAAGQGYLHAMTLAEIQTYRFDKAFPQYADMPLAEVTAPRLETFLDWFVTTEMTVNIEIKNNIFPYPGIVAKVLTLLETYGVSDRVIISSFNHRTIKEVKTLAPHQVCGFLTECSLLDPGAYCDYHQVECYHPLFVSMTPEEIHDCQERGIAINVWTVNEPDHIARMIAAGVDGIITNCVDIARFMVNRKTNN